MPISKTWNNTSYPIPLAGEVNWSSLTTYLQALADNAQTTNKQLFGTRIATASPVAVNSTTDTVIITNLTIAGAVAVNLPAGQSGRIVVVLDGKADAATNNITITPSAGQTIDGAATYVMALGRQSVVMVFDGGTNWNVAAEFKTVPNNETDGLTSTDLSGANQTITLGTTLFYPNLIIPIGQTYTIAGTLVSVIGIQSLGTLVSTGTVKVLS